MLPIGLFRFLLWCYPAPFRQEYGSEMTSAFQDDLRAARRNGGWLAEAGVWMRMLADLFLTAPVEHFHMILHDLRYSVRTLALEPGFAAVAVLSLALGIGANLAVFSLLHSLMFSRLPVQNPEGLVMLTDPGYSGVGHGSRMGERPVLTYSEFEALRERCRSFSTLMAVQSQMERVAVRVNGGDPEQIRYRLVSSDYFPTLGVEPQFGRAFDSRDGSSALLAVISHS